MHDVWMLQARMEKRTGRATYAMLEHPRFRAAYDFMMLRLAVGHVDPELCRWWAKFAVASEEERQELIEEGRRDARRANTRKNETYNPERKSARELGIAESLPPGVGSKHKDEPREDKKPRGNSRSRSSAKKNSAPKPKKEGADANSEKPRSRRRRKGKKLTQQEIAKAMDGQPIS